MNTPIEQIQKQTTEKPQQMKKKTKQNKQKLIIGASDYEPNQQKPEEKQIEQKPQYPKQKHHVQKKNHQKTHYHNNNNNNTNNNNNNNYHNQQQQPHYYQPNANKMFEVVISSNIMCLFEENSLSCGSFIRRFMDDNGFIALQIFAQLFTCPVESIKNAVKLILQLNKKFVYDNKNMSIGLSPEYPNYSLPAEERIVEIKENELPKYQKKAYEWIMRGSRNVNVSPAH